MTELWSSIEGYDYSISSFGRVRNGRGRILSQWINNKGYRKVTLSRKGETKGFFVHRLVASGFIPNPRRSPQINHINGVKADNRAENLEWCDNRYNNRNKINRNTKPVPVYSVSPDGGKVFFSSIRHAASVTGLSRYGILAACEGFQNTCGGLRWHKTVKNVLQEGKTGVAG